MLFAENVEPDDQLLAIASRNRNQILAELTAHYGRTISNEQGTARLGVVLCLLQEFRVCVFPQSNRVNQGTCVPWETTQPVFRAKCLYYNIREVNALQDIIHHLPLRLAKNKAEYNIDFV